MLNPLWQCLEEGCSKEMLGVWKETGPSRVTVKGNSERRNLTGPIGRE